MIHEEVLWEARKKWQDQRTPKTQALPERENGRRRSNLEKEGNGEEREKGGLINPHCMHASQGPSLPWEPKKGNQYQQTCQIRYLVQWLTLVKR